MSDPYRTAPPVNESDPVKEDKFSVASKVLELERIYKLETNRLENEVRRLCEELGRIRTEEEMLRAELSRKNEEIYRLRNQLGIY
jgi:predicted nuclease with TOPRIM domain